MYEKLFNGAVVPDINSPDLTDIRVACLRNKTAVVTCPCFNSYGTGDYIRTPFLCLPKGPTLQHKKYFIIKLSSLNINCLHRLAFINNN